MALSKEDSTVRIVLLGKTGSGKSATGNTIVGHCQFNESYSPISKTEESERVCINLEERPVWVIDTPGLFDTHKSEDEVKYHIEKALELASPGPHVFLLVISLMMKFTKEEMNTVKWIQENFGDEVKKHILVLFTHGNKLVQRNKRVTIEQYIQGSELEELVKCMAECHVFENGNDGEVAQVTELLKKIDKIRHRNIYPVYTKDMYEKAQREQKKKSMKYAGIGGGAAGAAGGGVAAAAVTTAAGMAKAGIVIASAATGGLLLAGLATGAVAIRFFMRENHVKEKKINERNKKNE